AACRSGRTCLGRAAGTTNVVLLALLVAAAVPPSSEGQPVSFHADVNGHSLHPPYFNLAEGTKISATATCGEEESGANTLRPVEDLYCKLVGGPVAGGEPNQTIQGQYCDICSSANSNKAHPITNAIDGTERWWQSPPLSRRLEFNEVNVTLDLGQLFHVAYVLIKFANSPRPDLWVLERSTDFGLTYEPWQYFASSKRDCIEKFGLKTVERITKDDDAICTTEYSRIVPLENGEIVVSLVNGRPGAMNFSYSPLLRNFTKATNIRLRFLRTNTLLGHLMGKALRDPTVTRRYYYSIKDISIGGRCVCHGHADVCDARDPTDPYRLHCDCQHNTCGGSCDHCCPGFNQFPWKPATTDSANECEPCNCNAHAYDCYYDPEVDRHRASKNRNGLFEGGGVCIDCQHHTAGINCERCSPGYYKSPDHPIDSPYICYRCNCESDFMDGTCEDLTGRCYCKPNYTGEDCDACADGYVDFPHCYYRDAPHGHTAEFLFLPPFLSPNVADCDCNVAGTRGNACRKDAQIGLCLCKPNFQGTQCDQCVPGYYGPNCQPCQCSGAGFTEGTCDSETAQCLCRTGFEGYACDRCAPGYFNYPLCQLCGCSAVGTLPEGCDASGRCYCRPEYDGPRCDQCSFGYHSYPHCQACSCDPLRSVDNDCSPIGQCRCHSNYIGHTCNQCAPGFYGYPTCSACQCSTEGSLYGTCDQETGQCTCRPRVIGLRCDACIPGAYGFPHCEVGSCNPAGLANEDLSLPPEGSCECRAYVEGEACDRCKPLYWNLTPDNPFGCIRYYNLDGGSYFGCQGCHCDIGGSVGPVCEEKTGSCRCRANTQGPACTQPAKDHYIPDLHHLKYELEEGTTLDGKPVRFGYNPLEFEDFSWRGYTQMSPIQPKVVVTLSVTSPDLFRLVFRYINRGPANVEGRVSVLEEGKFNVCGNCTEQMKQIVFAPAKEPTFVTVPQNSFGEPFVLSPQVWSLVIEAENVLLDYLVLLPSSYYEAPILQMKVSDPCTYSPSNIGYPTEYCLLYKFVPVEQYPFGSGEDALCKVDNSLPRPCVRGKVSPTSPDLVVCSGSDVEVQMWVGVPQSGRYALLVEYANENTPQTIGVEVRSPQHVVHQGTLTLYTCKYSFLCRGAVLDSLNRLAAFELSTEATIKFTADWAHFFLYKVYLVPYEQFTWEFVEPKVHCISTHGTFSPNSSSCVPSRYQKISQSVVLEEGQFLPVAPDFPLIHAFSIPPVASPPVPPIHPPTLLDSSAELILLQAPQTAIVFRGRVQSLGLYAFILHCYQPSYPTFPVEVLINGGRIWQGQANATFCPHGYGCRSLVVSENQTVLDVADNDLSVIIRVPKDRHLWLDYILVVPESSYGSSYLSEELMDKSYDFISSCGLNGFYINPATSSRFCQDSAASISLFYNNGAQPCHCHEAGAVRSQCEAFGGQCTCKSNVIGRACSRCATGYWGFPNCRPCDCGPRLCDEVTGQCICPPHTVQPECTVCEPQTFGCHPLVGCEDCNCSSPGIQDQTEPGCNVESGQCRCKPNIVGRQCDLCAPGYYGYPNCRRCDCHLAGTKESVCDPVTGQCHCKENVEGPKCDQCHLGTFSLDASNPKGCTKCFCFGATDRCHSAEKYRVQFIDMSGWTLLSGDRQEVPTSVSLEEESIHADLRNFAGDFQELYWHAPRPYLGDQVSSYGGYLRYELHSDTQRGDVFIPKESRPDVILKGNQMSIMFREGTYPIPGEIYEGQLQLLEDNFRHTETHNPVSREELMMVLAKLEQLQIRAFFSQISSSVSLHRVTLERATETGGGLQASNVELCMCPANYRGDSCQECAPGYYRDTKGLFLGKCVPCTCNGHSDQCLPGSGICINCQHNTEGEHCDRCKDGFVGNLSLDGRLQCVGCPCPLSVASNNFAVGCIQKGTTTQCLCKPGYAGVSCERCAPGYYGNPLVIGSSCQPCDCSGNADPNMLFSDCDSLTGICTGCMHNTAGPRCEVCAPGFYGDAVLAKNCTECSCLSCGTDSCDPRTGQCRCKPGVTGQRCSHCQEGHFGYETCSGCQRCDCDVGSVSTDCHAQNGQCNCSPGVSGPRCQQCIPGYWGLSPHGCSKCQCNGGSCNPWTGECTCSNGLTGKQCDTCVKKHEIPVVDGPDNTRCEACDSCVLLLLEDLQKIGSAFPALRHQLTSLNATSIAWARLHSINGSMQAIAVCGPNTLPLCLHEKDWLVFCTALTYQMGTITTTNASATSAEEFRQKMAAVDAMLRSMKATDFRFQRATAAEEHDEAQKLLDRVKVELLSKLESNQELVDHINSQLDRYSSELMDLRDALNEAVNKTRQTEDLNSLNRNHLEETQSKELQKQYGTIQETLRMAEDSLAQVSDFLQIIESIKEESEKLAAQLDGARYTLSEKAKEYSLASTKIPIVEKAENHAELLDKLAQNLSSIIHGTNQDGFIQRAVNASNAYSSIIEAVRNAERAANEANRAADEAVMVRLQLMCLPEPCQGGALQAAKNRLAGLQTKKEQLQKQLQSVKNTLDMVQDGTAEAIQNAKDAAMRANETVARMEGRLSDMKSSLDEWKERYGDLRSEDLNQAVRDAKNTVSSLESTLPELLGKLSNLENRRSHNATVSDNILRVRQLISLARNAVSKIKVPVKFNGTSGVQVRTPSNLQDLAAYTSLKFFIQNPEPKLRQKRQSGDDLGRFVLYFGSRDATGDYMGIILKDRKVQWIYKLGDEEPAYLTVNEEIGDQFAAVSINRILQYGHMSVTMEKHTLHETKGDSVAKGQQGLFNFKPSNLVLYVGGYPSSFMPPAPLRYPNYRGCIEMDSLNEEVMSLYNFQRTFHLDTAAERPCTRSKSTGDPWLTDGSYFDGTGYAEISFESQIGTVKRFEQEMRLVSYNGILFFLKHKNQLLCLAIREGKLVLYYDFSEGLKVAPPSRDPASLIVSSNTNKAIQIFLLKMNSKDRILVRLEQSTVFVVEQQNALQNGTSYYLGGVPMSILPESLKKIFPKGGSIRGCMKGLKALGKYVDLKRMNTTGVSYGCTLDLLVARSVKFHGHGFLTLSLRNVPSLQDFYTGFGFRTSQSHGLMYHHETEEGTCQVSLQNGRVSVSLLSTELTTKNAYADDVGHYVAVYSNATGIQLYIDDQLQEAREWSDRRRMPKQQDEPVIFQLGGLPRGSGTGNLTGCIGNVFVRRCVRARQGAPLLSFPGGASLPFRLSCSLCAEYLPCGFSPVALTLLQSIVQIWSQSLHSICYLWPTLLSTSVQSSDCGILLFFDRFHFSMEVKLNSSSGLLFYVADESLASFFSLFVSSGRVVLLADINGHKLRIRTKEKYHDGKWHTVRKGNHRAGGQFAVHVNMLWGASNDVIYRRSGRALQAREGNPGPQPDSQTAGPATYFTAWFPFLQDASAISFKGCLRHVQLDRKPLVSPRNVFGVTPCYAGPLESGTFFSADGGYIILGTVTSIFSEPSAASHRTVSLWQSFELMLEIRPRSAVGLIFHIGAKQANYLRLYTDKQKVKRLAVEASGYALTILKVKDANIICSL
uniref:Laminin subunit alpha-5 n=1 Tax=Varanus komodoensis TaxID=61221 RepID=A0A8D2J8L5_VARKO